MLSRQCDEYRRVYADILYAWDLLDKRSEVLKYQVGKLAQLNGQVKLRSICHQCGQLVKGPSCKESHCFAFTCSICNLSVRGECRQNCYSTCHACRFIYMYPSCYFLFSACIYRELYVLPELWPRRPFQAHDGVVLQVLHLPRWL